MGARETWDLLASGYNEGPDRPGIHAFAVSADGKNIEALSESNGIASPSYCAIHEELLFAASETPDQGGLASCTIDDAGVVKVNEQLRFNNAAGTCFVLRHPEGKSLYGADYDSGSICQCALNRSEELDYSTALVQHQGYGAPRNESDPNFDRQTGPHVHTLSFIPHTTLVAAVDLGLDLIAIYQTNKKGRIVDAEGSPTINVWPGHLAPEPPLPHTEEICVRPQPRSVETAYYETPGSSRPVHESFCVERSCANIEGNALAQLPLRPAAIVEAPLYAGPRIIAYHPNGGFAALICELSCELIIFRIDDEGRVWNAIRRWDLLQWAKGPVEGDRPPLAAHCEFSADGRFLYASVRGTDQLIVFTLDDRCDRTDVFTCSSEGGTPRHFALSPDQTQLAVANQTGNNIALFQRDTSTGALEFTASVPCSTPSCIIWKSPKA